MRLAGQNITMMLNDEIQIYVPTVSYDRLRSDCITVAPITAVAQAVTSKLNTIAAEEIADRTNDLTRQAHHDQIEQDKSEEIKDKDDAIRYKQEKKRHDAAVSSLNTERLIVEGLYMFQQLVHSGAHGKLQAAESKVRNLERQINDIESRSQEHHGHPSHHEHHNSQHTFNSELTQLRQALATEKSLVSRLHADERQEWATFYQHQSNKNRIDSDISRHKAEIINLLTQESELDRRQCMRNQRRSAPARSRQALSSSNASQLHSNIIRVQRETNDLCENMRRTATHTCHQTFLNQLKDYLSARPQLSTEKGALLLIIVKMNDHLRDLAVKQREELTLSQLKDSLQSNRTSLAGKERDCTNLMRRNETLVNDNERLGSAFGTLQSELKSLQEQRNFYAKASLGTAVGAGVGSVSAYFLIQAGIIALIPVVNLVVAVVVGVALLALITKAIIDAVGTSFKQAEVADCEQKIANNHRELESNRQTLFRNQGADLPNLSAAIIRIEKHIADQTSISDTARNKAASSLREAEEIQLTPSYIVGNHPNSIFAANEIPIAIGVVIEGEEASAPPFSLAQAQTKKV